MVRQVVTSPFMWNLLIAVSAGSRRDSRVVGERGQATLSYPAVSASDGSPPFRVGLGFVAPSGGLLCIQVKER